jgi:hypothetical protein
VDKSKITDTGIYFTYFLRQVNETALTEYFDKLSEFVETGRGEERFFPKEEYLEKFLLLSKSDFISSKLAFPANDGEWIITFFNTKIPHFEAEIAINTDNINFYEQVSSKLLTDNLASVVMRKTQHNHSFTNSILRFLNPFKDFSLAGRKIDIYFLLKLDSIPALRKIWKRITTGQDNNYFYSEILDISGDCITNGAAQVSVPFKIDALQNFLNGVDAEMLPRLEKENFVNLLSRYSVDINDWLNTKI